MTRRFDFPVEMSQDEDGFILAEIPDLPWATTQGDDEADALVQAVDSLETALGALMADGDAIPVPSPARGRRTMSPATLLVFKVALYEAMRDAGVNKVALAERLDCDEKEVRRLLDPKVNSKIPRLEAALAVLGKRVMTEIRDAA